MLCVLLNNLEWIFGTYKLNVLTSLWLLILCIIFTWAHILINFFDNSSVCSVGGYSFNHERRKFGYKSSFSWFDYNKFCDFYYYFIFWIGFKGFVWVFCLHLPYVLFFIYCSMLHHPPWSATSVGNLSREDTHCLDCDGDTSVSILIPGKGFWAPSNFRLSITQNLATLKLNAGQRIVSLNAIDP